MTPQKINVSCIDSFEKNESTSPRMGQIKNLFAKATATVLIPLAVLSSCGTTKEIPVKPAPTEREKAELALKEVGLHHVRFIDTTSIRVFQGITTKMLTDPRPYDSIFAETMASVSDSLENMAKEYNKARDSLLLKTAGESNAEYKEFRLPVGAAKQSRAREALGDSSNVNSYQNIVPMSYQIGDIIYLILRGEPVSPKKMDILDKNIIRFNSIKDIPAGSSATKEIIKMYIVAAGLDPDKKWYTPEEANKVRELYAKTVQTGALWNAFRKSRFENNR